MRLRILAAVSLIFFSACNSRVKGSAETAQPRVRMACFHDGSIFPLKAVEGKGSASSLVEFQFSSGKFTAPALACAQWLEGLPDDLKGLPQESLVRLLTSEKSPEARLSSGSLRERLYQKCEDFPDCKLRYPYNYLHAPLAALSERLRIARKPAGEEACMTGARGAGSAPKPALKRRVLLPFQPPFLSKAWVTPVSSFERELKDEISPMNAGSIVLFREKISSEDVLFLKTALQHKPAVTAYLVYSLSAALMDPKPFEALDHASQIKPIPIADLPGKSGEIGFNAAFIRTPASSTAIFSGKTSPEPGRMDLGFEIVRSPSPEFSRYYPDAPAELGRLLFQTVLASCQEGAPLMACSLRARYSAPLFQASSAPWMEQHYQGCAAILGDPLFKDVRDTLNLERTSALRVADTREAGAYTQVIRAIQGARKSISLSSTGDGLGLHLHDVLARKSAEGVKIQVISDQARSRGPASSLGLVPGANLVIVDGRKAVWMSTDVSHRALSRSGGLFFVTEEKTLIHTFEAYFATLLRSEGLGSPFLQRVGPLPKRVLATSYLDSASGGKVAEASGALRRCLRFYGDEAIYTPAQASFCKRFVAEQRLAWDGE